MNKKIVVAGSALSLAVSAIGISALSGCKSYMTALNSDMPNAVNGSLKGEYVLEQVKSNAGDIGADAIRAAVQKDATAQSIFKGKADNKNALPIDITVDCVSKEANGGIASFNNLLSLCTLTLWPCVDAKEYEYTVTASSVVGSHKVSFKVLDRNWFGLSPFAMIPVPGWSDERGDEAELKQFHAAQIALAAKEACAELPNDYAKFKKDQPKYLELISQSRSEMAFAAFLAAKAASAKVDALSKVVNDLVITKHQNDLATALNSDSDGAVCAAILSNSYWSKLSDSRLLAMVYRDGYAKLSEADRKNLVAKISDDAVLTEMVTAPSQDAQREAQNKREKQQYELKEKISELQRDAENHKRYAKSANDNFRFSEAKRENKEVEKCMVQIAALQKKMAGANAVKNDGLYVKDAKARVTLYQAMKPEMVKKLADAILAAHTLSDWNNKDISALESVADMSVAVADKNVSAEIAISLACKVDSYWRECKGSWSYRWDDADKKQWAALKKKITPALTDDILVSKIKADRKLWSALAELIQNRENLSPLAVVYISESRATKNAEKLKEAWNRFGSYIVDDAALEEIAIKEPVLRDVALAQIKGDAAKKHAQTAIQAELALLAAIRKEKINKVIPVAENDANDILLLFAKTGMNDVQREAFIRMYNGHILIFRNATVWNNNCDSDNTAHRVLMHAAFPSKEFISSNRSIDFFADFSNGFKKNSRKLEGFKQADVVTIVKEGNSFCFFTDAAVLDRKNDAAIVEAFLNDRKVSDEMLDVVLAGAKDRIVLKLANEVDLEFPKEPQSTQPRKSGSLGEALKAAGELSQQINDIKAAKQEVGKAWSDLKGEVEKGMSEVISEKDKADLKKSMDDLKSAADALKNLTK